MKHMFLSLANILEAQGKPQRRHCRVSGGDGINIDLCRCLSFWQAFLLAIAPGELDCLPGEVQG